MHSTDLTGILVCLILCRVKLPLAMPCACQDVEKSAPR